MKAAAPIKKRPACCSAWLKDDGSLREHVFGVKLAALERPLLGPYPRAMQHGQASVTALGAAGHRAAHQVLEHGFAFADPLALRILGQDADGAIALATERPERRSLRLFIAMRSRFAEDSAESGGMTGALRAAGLDTEREPLSFGSASRPI
jgi:hypothetical protein